MSPKRSGNSYGASMTGSGARIALLLSALIRVVKGLPIGGTTHGTIKEPMSNEDFYLNLLISVFLVMAGGVFAGLTLGLMGQDEVYLKVIASSGEPKERKYARKVLGLINRGKHWVLVTLLLSNVITNESLPIVLDRCLGGGWPAVVASSASIVIFGEIIPQSICFRYGLQVGALFSPVVLILMYIMYPVAYPCALLLDHVLGEDHGTVYKKSGLKTLVTLHKTMGVERLNQDEVTIISAVLDLKEKAVAQIMTPIDRVYTMPSDMILDEKTVEEIFNAGFSRIPIHLPNEPTNFIGMLLVRVLISYDPEDALPVALFPLATLPETGADTSCLNILNYFQEGKSHMIVVSDSPGEPTGALGVLTLEDVIEELIGEEIVDESDVYIDINRNIKRKNPGPLYKRSLTAYLHNLYNSANTSKRNSFDITRDVSSTMSIVKSSPLTTSPNRAKSSTIAGVSSPMFAPVNPASNPLETSKPFVTIKRPNPASEGNKSPHIKTVPLDRDLVLDGPKSVEAYGKIFTSEQGVLEEAQHRLATSHDHDVEKNERHDGEHRELCSQRKLNGQKDDIEGQLTLSPLNGHTRTGSSSETLPLPVIEYLELRSYRTGGIVESVVNVLGVHKTIIEDFSDEDPTDLEDPIQRGGRRLCSTSEQSVPLIY